jgi:hypothetical protein
MILLALAGLGWIRVGQAAWQAEAHPRHCVDIPVFCTEFENNECPLPAQAGPAGGFIWLALCGDLKESVK